MTFLGIIIHHSACSSINGKGYDYLIAKDGSVIPAQEKTDPEYLHICVEGDFSLESEEVADPEQLFLLQKLILRLCQLYDIPLQAIRSHGDRCPEKISHGQNL